MSSEIGKNLPPAENSAGDSPGIDSEFLAGRFMEEAQQTAPGEAFIMNPVTGETHKATVVTDLAKEAEEGGPGLRYLKPKPTPAEHEIAIRDYLAAKTAAGEEAASAVLDMVEELIHMEECNQRMHSKSVFEMVLLNRSDPKAGKEAFERNRADFHEVRQGKHRVLKLRKDLPDELKQKLDLDSALLRIEPLLKTRVVFGDSHSLRARRRQQKLSPK